MALQLRFFMVEEDERELLRRLERLELELWPELTHPSERPPIVSPSVALEDDAYYLAKGDVIGHQIKKGPDRGRFRIDEVVSPVIYFCRSRLDEDGELRSGYFWAETEAQGDQARLGGKPARFLSAVRELREIVSTRFRKSEPVRGTTYFVGPAAARLAKGGLTLREAGRKGEPVRVYR
ncbi:MAG: hypothetical protein ACJ78U_11800 [Myxococcales bacterium]